MPNTSETDSSSEAVRDYLEQIPSQLIRWGTIILCFVLFILFSITWFIEYPSIVRTDFKLISVQVPKPVIAKVNGRLESLFVTDNQVVKKGQTLGYVESTAKHEEVLSLDKELDQLVSIGNQKDLTKLKHWHLKNYQNLGDVQLAYQDFQKIYVQTLALFSDGYYQQKQNFLKNDIQELIHLSQNLKNQKTILNQDVALQEKEFKMNQSLYKQNIIAPAELNKEESKLLAKKIPIKNTETFLINNTMLIRSKEKELLDLDKLALEQKETFKQSLNTLRSVIALWKNKYILTTPSQGVVNFTNSLQAKQNLKANSIVLYVADHKNKYLGEIKIPQDNFGKIKTGQTVLIKFQGYPFEEFGAAEGQIKSIAQIPTPENKSFYAIVTLPNGQKTTNNTNIIFRNGMTASAEIITENKTLAERLFYSFKKGISR
ncbi:HlyD family efflux transporter periplasmic adaptor subunit [uncultured Flavobacterium sp.]|uniref:HlyD family secretion protein n=1 Tax=uncultured Flavobacterium sp. TaxID=165435 RepID=UPI003081D1B5